MQTEQTAPAGAARQANRTALSEGPVVRGLAVATAPLAMALVVMFGIQLAEAWLTGLLGPHALAAMGFVIPIVMTVMSFGIGLGAGATAVVARALGAGEAAGRLSLHALLLAAAVALGLALSCAIGAEHLLHWLGAEGVTQHLALGYLQVWLLGAVPLLTGMVALGIARAAGDMRFGGSALAGAGILGFLLDWPLAFGLPGVVPGLGLPGLAAAAGLAWTAMLLASLHRLRQLGLLTVDGTLLGGFAASTRRVLRVGLPAAGTNAIIPIANGLFTAMLAVQGSAAVAGFGLGSRVESLALTALFALSAVTNPFAAQNAGAGRLDRLQAGCGRRWVSAWPTGWRWRCHWSSRRPGWRCSSPTIRRWQARPRSTFASCPGATGQSAPSPSPAPPSTGWSGRCRPWSSRWCGPSSSACRSPGSAGASGARRGPSSGC
jgi:Na+-driven multidrug efflux pump